MLAICAGCRPGGSCHERPGLPMNLLRALATVSGMTFLSRILGYVRDALIAGAFGAGLATDAFFVAFRLPNLLRRLFAEGAFSQAFVPIFAEYKNRESAEDTRVLVNCVASVLGLVLIIVTALGMVCAPLVVYLSAPGFAATPEKFELTTHLLRLTFPYIACISLVAFAAGILNTHQRFAVPAFTPVLLNVSFIVAAAFFAPYFDPPVLVLGWAVLFGGLLQLLLQLPFLVRLGLLPRWQWNWRHPGLQRVLKLMAPAVFGVSISQISLLINTIFASFLAAGSVSWLYYADRLMEFPAGMLGVALGTILLPSLSKYHAQGAVENYSALLDWGLRLTLLLAVPAAAALAVLAMPLIATLFHYGRFTHEDAWMTQHALIAYSVGLTGMILVKILAPGFYARQNVVTPVKIGVITLLTTQALNLLLIGPLQHAGLALAIGLGACLNAAMLYICLRQHGIYTPQPGWLLFALKIVLAVSAMCFVLWFAMGPSQWWLDAKVSARVIGVSGLVVLGVGVYAGVLWICGFRPRDFARRAAE